MMISYFIIKAIKYWLNKQNFLSFFKDQKYVIDGMERI